MSTIRRVDMLLAELGKVASELPAFKEHAYSVFNLEDMVNKTEQKIQSLPIIGVTYDGAVPNDGNQVNAVDMKSGSVTMVTFQFSIILAIQYNFSNQRDTKPQATDLLDEMRSRINGYRGISNRPWVYAGEKPEDVPSVDGMVFYSQAWRTMLPVVGKFNKQ